MGERSDESGDSGRGNGYDDAERGRILGTTTVSRSGRISVVEGVKEAFGDRGVGIEEGNLIVYRDCDETVVVEPA